MENSVKRNVKDSVFTHLFSIPKYRKELYVTLHPEDADINENELESVTLSNILANGPYNDLGIFAKQKIIILIEAQSTWSENILWRMLYYLAESYRRKWTEDKLNIYGSKKVYLPIPELYVVYTGEKQLNKEILSLKEEFFDNKETPLDLKVKIIMSNKIILPKHENNDIINQYINFVKIYDKNRLLKLHKKECIEKTINECIENNILIEYLTKYKVEVTNMIDVEAEQAFATECIVREAREEGIQQGMQQGLQQGVQQGLQQGMQQGKNEGELLAFIKLYNNNLIKSTDAAKILNISEDEFLKKAKEYNA